MPCVCDFCKRPEDHGGRKCLIRRAWEEDGCVNEAGLTSEFVWRPAFNAPSGHCEASDQLERYATIFRALYCDEDSCNRSVYVTRQDEAVAYVRETRDWRWLWTTAPMSRDVMMRLHAGLMRQVLLHRPSMSYVMDQVPVAHHDGWHEMVLASLPRFSCVPGPRGVRKPIIKKAEYAVCEHLLRQLTDDPRFAGAKTYFEFKPSAMSGNRFRVDMVIENRGRVVLSEIDEHQHGGYDDDRERELIVLSFSRDQFRDMRVFMVRMNPNRYRDRTGKLIDSPWVGKELRQGDQHADEWARRLAETWAVIRDKLLGEDDGEDVTKLFFDETPGANVAERPPPPLVVDWEPTLHQPWDVMFWSAFHATCRGRYCVVWDKIHALQPDTGDWQPVKNEPRLTEAIREEVLGVVDRHRHLGGWVDWAASKMLVRVRRGAEFTDAVRQHLLDAPTVAEADLCGVWRVEFDGFIRARVVPREGCRLDVQQILEVWECYRTFRGIQVTDVKAVTHKQVRERVTTVLCLAPCEFTGKYLWNFTMRRM